MAFPRWDRLDYQPYFDALAQKLALKDWTVIVKDEGPDDGDAQAQSFLTYGRRRTRIYLSEGFLKDKESGQRHTACHELIHCHLDQLERMVVDTPEMRKAARLCLELAVDALADAIAPLMPLPSQVLDKSQPPKVARKPRKRK